MKIKIRQVVSFVMAIAIVMSLAPINTFAITESDSVALTAAASNITVSKSSEAQVVNVIHYILEDAQIAAIGVTVTISDPNNVGATFVGGATNAVASIAGGINIPAGGTSGAIASLDQYAGYQMPYNQELGGYVITTIPVSIPANAVGTFTVTFSNFAHADFDNAMGYSFNNASATATITVEEPKAPAGEYEIFYKLNSTTDVEDAPDDYMEYDIKTEDGKKVAADVYIRNNTDEDVSLQAYDIYLTHDSNLIFGTFAPDGITNENAVNAVATSGQLTRIQAIGENTDAADINITLPANDDDGVKLGTINFTFGPNAEYEQELPITLTSGSKEQGNTSTNISVANIVTDSETTGNKESYYPVNASEVLGAEINTKHTITWNPANGTEATTTAVGHNILPVYDGKTPTKEGADGKTYTFKEWTPAIVKATTDATYTATYTEEVNTYTVTWKDWNDDVLGTTTVEHGETPVYSGTPTRTEDNQYTYTFKAWTPTIVAATKDAEYTATYTATPKTYQITFNVGEGSLPDGYTSPMDYNCDQSTLLPLPTRDGYAFNGWLLATTVGGWDANTYYDSDTVNGKWGDVTLVALWLDAEFEVTIGASEHGSVTATPMGGAEGDTITLNAFPDPGYKLDRYSVTYTDNPNQIVEVADDGTFELPAADVTVTATFVKANLDINVEKNTLNGTVAVDPADKTAAQVEETVTLTNSPAAGYELDKYTVTYNDGTNDVSVDVTVDTTTGKGTFTMPAYPVTVTATFQKKDLAITIDPTIQNGIVVAKKDETKATTAQVDDVITLDVTPADGYKLVENSVKVTSTEDPTQTVEVNADGTFTMPAYPVTVTAQFELDTYTIIFDLDGGNWNRDNSMTYTIESTNELPSPTKANYDFAGWQAKEAAGNWATTLINPGYKLNSNYGDVELVAKWTPRGDLKVEEYKYAADGYVMLRVADAGLTDGQVYQFGTGADATMYYMSKDVEDADKYLVATGDSGVYYTLIPVQYAEKQGETLTGKLTSAGLEQLQAVEGNKATINYDGKINDDAFVNIADANIVYQMIVNGGGYYGDLDIEYRLKADMHKESYNSSVARATIEDVAAIMAIINGTN